MFIGSEVMTYSPHFFSSFIYQYIKLNPCPHETSDMASNKIIIYDTVWDYYIKSSQPQICDMARISHLQYPPM